MMSSLIKNIKQGFLDTALVWKREIHNVFRDPGVVIFFLLLPALYPVLYTLIYNPELVREVPVVVVDNDRSAESRKYTRSIDANQYVKIIGYAANRSEAKTAMNEKECYGILEIPHDFAKKLGRGEQTRVDLYADMSLLVQYKGMLTALSETTLEIGGKLHTTNSPDLTGAMMPKGSMPIETHRVAIGNTSTGFASFLIPGILILVLQQSLLLGICMLGAGARERRRATHVADPNDVNTGVAVTLAGKALCYYTVYIVMTMYVLYFVPHFFSLPQIGNPAEINIFITPFLLSSIFFGMIIQNMAREREDCFLLIVFTSVVFLFLSGLLWPRYAMPEIWQLVSWIVPSTWAVDGFVHLNTDGAALYHVAPQYHALWILSALYFIVAYLLEKLRRARMCKE